MFAVVGVLLSAVTKSWCKQLKGVFVNAQRFRGLSVPHYQEGLEVLVAVWAWSGSFFTGHRAGNRTWDRNQGQFPSKALPQWPPFSREVSFPKGSIVFRMTPEAGGWVFRTGAYEEHLGFKPNLKHGSLPLVHLSIKQIFNGTELEIHPIIQNPQVFIMEAWSWSIS